MIAEACIATNLPPEAFGVPSSPALGQVMLDLLQEQAKAQKERELIGRLKGR